MKLCHCGSPRLARGLCRKHYEQDPDVKARRQELRRSPGRLANSAAYHKQPHVKKKKQAFACREENLQKRREYYKAKGHISRARYLASSRGKELGLASKLKRCYNLSKSEYGEMAKRQLFSCAICYRGCDTGGRLGVDHNHVTGKVRGLLCRKCNTGLGMFKDNEKFLERAWNYLKKHNQ